jgi:hypothetical protein
MFSSADSTIFYDSVAHSKLLNTECFDTMIAVREYETECSARHVQLLVRMDQGN